MYTPGVGEYPVKALAVLAEEACDSIGVGDVPNVGPSMLHPIIGGDSAKSRSVGYVSLVCASGSLGVIEFVPEVLGRIILWSLAVLSFYV